MVFSGVKSSRVDQKSLSDELIVNRGGSTGRQSVGALATQLAQTSPISALGAATKFVSTYVGLPAASTLEAGTPRTVVADDDGDNNGTWFVDDSSGTKVWSYGYPLPFSNIRATDTGAGTANAIKAYTNAPVSESVQIVTRLYRANLAGPTTISFNDGAELTIRSIDGVAVTQAGLLAAGRQISGFINSTYFDLTTDLLSAANLTNSLAAQAAAEVAQELAEAARDIAAGYASDAVSQGNVPIYSTIDGMPAISVPVGILSARLNGKSSAGDGEEGLFVRVSSDPGAALSSSDKFRSQDRFLPNGSTDSANGGWWLRKPGTYGTREKLQSLRTYYVRSDGNDANDGLVDSSAGAFATWQKAVDVASLLDFNGYNIFIEAGSEAGVKTWDFSEILIRTQVGNGNIYFRGNGENTVLNASGQCFSLYDTFSTIRFGKLKLISAGGYGTIVANGMSPIGFDDLTNEGPNFGGASSGSHIFIHDNGAPSAILGSTYKITGPAVDAHIWAGDNSSVSHESNVIDVDDEATASWYVAAHGGCIKTFNNSVSGSFAGRRAYVSTNGVVHSIDYGSNDIPGTPEVVDSGGVFLENGASKAKYTDITVDGGINGNSFTSPAGYSPTVSALSGSFAVAPDAFLKYSTVNGLVTVSGTIHVPAGGVGSATAGILITAPFVSSGDGVGSAYDTYNDVSLPCIYNKAGSGKILIKVNPQNDVYYTFTISWPY